MYRRAFEAHEHVPGKLSVFCSISMQADSSARRKTAVALYINDPFRPTRPHDVGQPLLLAYKNGLLGLKRP